MVDRSQSTKYVQQVIINRVITLTICLICALSLFYLYVVDITAPDGRDLRYLRHPIVNEPSALTF